MSPLINMRSVADARTPLNSGIFPSCESIRSWHSFGVARPGHKMAQVGCAAASLKPFLWENDYHLLTRFWLWMIRSGNIRKMWLWENAIIFARISVQNLWMASHQQASSYLCSCSKANLKISKANDVNEWCTTVYQPRTANIISFSKDDHIWTSRGVQDAWNGKDQRFLAKDVGLAAKARSHPWGHMVVSQALGDPKLWMVF